MKHFQLSFFGTWGAIQDWRRQSFRRQISQSPIMLARHVLFFAFVHYVIFFSSPASMGWLFVLEHMMSGLPWSCYYKLVHMSHSPGTLFFSWSAHRSKTLFIYHVWLLLMIAFLDFWIVQVIYQTNSFLEKNRDYVVFEHCNLLSLSKCTFVASLFPPQESSKSNYKFSSVATRFKVLIFPFVDSHNMA